MNIETTSTGTEFDFCANCGTCGDDELLFLDYNSNKWICQSCLNELEDAKEHIKLLNKVYTKE